jgi:hypothetical protein
VGSLVRGGMSSLGVAVARRVARPRGEPCPHGGDVLIGELVGRELVVIEPVQPLDGQGGVGWP